MCAMKTPGVYILEKNAFPNSVVETSTAVPAFIGYTQMAKNGNKSLLNKPFKVSSLAEFNQYFGFAPTPKFELKEGDSENFTISLEGPEKEKLYCVLERKDRYNLYYNLRFFFANGGGQCYIVSVGSYDDELSKEKFISGIDTLLEEQEPTMVLVPEAVNLENKQDCFDIQTAVLKHCGMTMRNRFAILDIYNGYKDRKDEDGDVVNEFREAMGTEFLDFGATYYPWLSTSIVSDEEVDFNNIEKESWDKLKELLNAGAPHLSQYIEKIDTDKYGQLEFNEINTINKVLSNQSKFYSDMLSEIKLQLNLLPPGAAMAGIYAMVDTTKNVWKAPANIGLSNVIGPVINISQATQEDLNMPISGKAVNAIRYFVGEGVKVWGARTLDGNSSDWRYINVRRTMMMLEESIKNATKAYVFEANTANTWVSVRSMINNFLNGIWKRGGLAGAIPDDAFSVHIGLGETMTAEDILDGIMRVTVLVALVRPAEFIEITFQQQLQKS